MHEIEPFYRWENYYVACEDELSPFFGRTYTDYCIDSIYGYYIHPFWDNIGSETLYVKLLFVDYERKFAIIELFGEWNDTLHNDVMHFKRTLIDVLLKRNINQFVLIGENIFNFHGSDELYYEEWFDDVEEGWICALNFRAFVQTEWKKYRLDYYLNFGGELDLVNWRTLSPHQLYQWVAVQMANRLGPSY